MFPRGRTLPFAFCLVVGALSSDSQSTAASVCGGNMKETEPVAFPLRALKGLRESQSCWKSLGCAWKYSATAGQSR